MEISSQKVWFVTGASKGLGLDLVKQLLEQGYKVAATSRNVEELKNAVGIVSDNFLPLSVQLNQEESIAKAIQETVKHFGKIEVIVNNAGYGLVGALEELSDAEARQNFDVNVFGSLNVIREALPYLRQQKSGHIFNIASIGGFIGAFPGFGIYCATKFAVHGFSESLATEVKPFGIKVTVVSPGYFRTNFLNDTSLSVPKNQITDYQNVRDVQNIHENDYNGNQNGDPIKAAKVMIEVAENPSAPLHLFLGADAYHLAELKMEAVKQDLEAFRTLATSTGFDN
ncbi:SDR family oxidoreductase [Arcicella lustrica]|uniref:SDR family oxidoreductase n=1 Tax=Arcicella lustrica TaxID=2984196 RepID=A0ABU5SKL5_9BACT|nr:SDR family oxidoreductase [Arcicella sp. DC25W]MEA5427791.1 SDR family oxidoreductase [Arcicella sp. DC25W]